MNRFDFLDDTKKIKINKYDTPTPWINYLSNGTFHAMISQAGGGLAFYKSPQIWRINHYRFFNLPTDRSGFYTYIKDNNTIFCPTNEPVKEKPDEWYCNHGMGYSEFHSKKNGLQADVKYFVGKYENCLIYEMKLFSDTERDIKIFPYVELGMMEYMREIQWQCYNKHQLTVYNLGNDILVYKYGVENQPKPEETPLIYFAGDVPINGYDGDRDEFIGAYRSEENPVRVEDGKCSNSTMMGGDPCFAMQIDLRLEAGKEKTVHFFLGAAMTEQEVLSSVKNCRAKGFAEKSFNSLKNHWEDYLSKFYCEVPDKNAQRMINIWNPYQAERNFQFSRNISYYATGTFRGVGYRDTAQDTEEVKEFAGFDSTVIFAASHDTASAVAATPMCDNDMYISSGTWSLIGIESKTVLINEEICKANFANEGGIDYRFRFLKNYMGMWLLQNIRKNLNNSLTYDEMMFLAEKSDKYRYFDVNHKSFVAPENMIDAIKEYFDDSKMTVSEVLASVYHSLAKSYKDAVEEIEALTGITVNEIHIVGGGCQDKYLNKLTAEYTGKLVTAGPVEATAVGNLISQMLYDKKFSNIASARILIKDSL